MHDGSLTSLEQVVALYASFQPSSTNQDPELMRIELSAQDQADLVDFLRGLEGQTTQGAPNLKSQIAPASALLGRQEIS